MKKFVALLTALVCLLSLAACAGAQTPASSAAEPGSAQPTANGKYSAPGEFPIVTEPCELTVWAIRSPAVEDYATNYQSEWYEEYSGVTVHWVDVPAQGWADAFQLSVMNEEWPDIYLYDFSPSEVQICVDYGVIIPIEDLIEQHCPNVTGWLENDPELKKTVTANDGHIYTLFAQSYNTAAYTQKLWVNREWLETYENATGNGMPQTTAEFEQMLLYFKQNDMNNNGVADEIPYMGCNGVDGMYQLLDAFTPVCSAQAFGCYVNEDGKEVFTPNTAEFREGLKYIHGLYEQGLISDESFTISNADRYAYTSTPRGEGRVGVVASVTVDGIVQLSNEENAMDYTDYVALPPLEGPEGCRSYVTMGENTVALKDAITTKCENPEIAAKWLDYWFSEEGRLWSVNGGQEGKHWWYGEGESIRGDGKVVVRSDDPALNKNACWAKQGVSYMVTEDDLAGMDLASLGTNSVLATYLADREYSKYAVQSGWPAIVWSDDMDAANEYGELLSLIEGHVTENYTAFIMGTRDIEDDAEWQDYVAKLDDMGLARFIELAELYVSMG